MNKIITFLALSFSFIAQAQVNKDWCKTIASPEFLAEYRAKDRSHQLQVLDQRAGIQYVGIVYHVVAKNDGSGATSLKPVFETQCELNEDFNKFGIGFYIVYIDTIKNTALWEYQNQNLGYQAFSQYNASNVCNVYVNGNLPGLCGFATFPNTAPKGGGIFMNTDCIGAGTTTLQHEMGHYLGLLHTFQDGDELVNGSNCASAGDGFCDTPADIIDYRAPCPYTGTAVDANGDFYNTVTDETMFMSYFNDACTDKFSLEQQAEMIDVLNNKRGNLLNQTQPDLTPVDTAIFVGPLNGDTTLASNSITITWNKVPRAEFYFFRMQSNTSNQVQADTLLRDTSITINNLIPNRAYKFRVRGVSFGNACSENTVYNVVKTSTIKATATIAVPSCPGEGNGEIVLTISNGSSPYNVEWSNGNTNTTLSNVVSGTYAVTITDNVGEILVTNYTVSSPPNINTTITKVGNNLNAYVDGGTPPYDYNWSNGVNGQFNNGVEPTGVYTVTVSDSKGCLSIQSFNFDAVGLQELTTGFKVYPNPIAQNNQLNIKLAAAEKMTLGVNLININGAIIKTQSRDLIAGNNFFNFDLSGVSAGVYTLRLSSAGGQINQRVTILK
jgi:hypothetical protein